MLRVHQTDRRILQALLRNENVTFRQLQRECGVSPRILKRHLRAFVQDGHVNEKGRDKDWKPGRALDYSLTRKGRQTAVLVTIDSAKEDTRILTETFSKMRDTFGVIVSRPDAVKDWQGMSVGAVLDTVPGAIHTEEQRRVIRDEIVKIYEPLVDAYRMMHKLVCQLWIPETAGSGDAFIGFTKDSSLSLIPTKVLEQKGLGSYLFSWPHRSAQRHIKGH